MQCETAEWMRQVLQVAGAEAAGGSECADGRAVLTAATLREMAAATAKALGVDQVPPLHGPVSRGAVAILLDSLLEKADY